MPPLDGHPAGALPAAEGAAVPVTASVVTLPTGCPHSGHVVVPALSGNPQFLHALCVSGPDAVTSICPHSGHFVSSPCNGYPHSGHFLGFKVNKLDLDIEIYGETSVPCSCCLDHSRNFCSLFELVSSTNSHHIRGDH